MQKKCSRDFRAGFNDAALMEKYKLSAAGLNSLKTKLTNANLLQAKRQINIDPIVKDLKLGMTEPDLMEKHQLTLLELQEIVRRLEEIGLVASEEVRHLNFLSDPIADAKTLFPLISISVYESMDSETLGQLALCEGRHGRPQRTYRNPGRNQSHRGPVRRISAR